MTPKQIQRKRSNITSKIFELNLKLKTLQSVCPHINLTGKYCADTGNWSPSDDSYWVSFHCLDCDLRWQEDQDKVKYSLEKRSSVSSGGFTFKEIK